MLSTIIHFSDDDMVLIIGIFSLLGLILLASAFIDMARRNRSDDGSSRNEPPNPNKDATKTQNAEVPNQIPTWKKIESSKTENPNQRKCVFCGAVLAEDQVFCGSCGRRVN